MQQISRFTLGGRTLPLDLHNVWVDAAGLPLTVADGPIAFDFIFRDIRFAGRYEQNGEDALLKLRGDAGPMPFTAEAGAARFGLARIVEAACDLLGPMFRIDQGRILIRTERAIKAPVTACTLVAAVAEALLPAAPYLELITVYVRPPMSPAKRGESAVRPEWRRRSVTLR